MNWHADDWNSEEFDLLRNRDEAAWAKLRDFCVSCLRKLCGEDASKVAQDFLADLSEKPKKLEQIANAEDSKRYLVRALHNKGYDHHRANGRRAARSAELESERLQAEAAERPDRLHEASAFRHWLKRCVKRLGRGPSRVWELAILGYTNSEIAEALRMSESNVGSQKRHGRPKLKKCLKRGGYDATI